MKRFILLLVSILWVSSCAHSIKDAEPDLVAADKTCIPSAGQAWPNVTAKINCFDSVEEPIIKRDAPVISDAFVAFSLKRKSLAQQYDDENAPSVEALNRYNTKLKEAILALAANEPKGSLLNN